MSRGLGDVYKRQLILTPIIYQKIKYLRLKERYMLPYIMSAGFDADTTSLPLVIYNLVNILTANFFSIGFFEYAFRMVLGNFFSLFATIVVLYAYYRKDMISRYDVEVLEDKPPKLAIREKKADINAPKSTMYRKSLFPSPLARCII